MGQSCPYGPFWADGFNGAYAHLSSRAAERRHVPFIFNNGHI